MNRGNVILFYPAYKKMGGYHWFPFPYLYIGPFLEKKGFTPIIIDARVQADWRGLLKGALSDALCLGITAMTGSDIKDAVAAAAIARETSPRKTVIWGGPHASALPAQTAESDYADIVVYGDGEYAMAEIVDRIYRKKDYADIPGIAYKRDGAVRRNDNPSRVLFDYDIFPGFHLIDAERYRSPNNVASIFTARGCPFKCTFCTTKDKGYSERSFKQVKEEILFVANKLGFKNIFFQDGTYFIRKKRVLDIARFLIGSGLSIKWKAKARANSLLRYSEGEMALLKRSGLVSLFFGIESGSKRILKNMRKCTKPQDAEKSAEICRRHKIEFYTSFMFAVPGETIDDLQATINHIKMLKKINPETVVQNCIYIPLPSTLMFEEAIRRGFQPPDSLEGWSTRSISSRFDDRNDVTWMPPKILKKYKDIYNKEFGEYKHLFEREKEGEYVSIFVQNGVNE